MKKKLLSAELFDLSQAALSEQFPALFNFDAPVPLKLGLRKDLRARFPEMRAVVLSGFLGAWCARPAYWQTCVTGAARYGLEGESGTVTAAEAAYAAQRIAQVQRKEARKAA